MRLTHKATDVLSAEAHRIISAGFRGKSTYSAIAKQLAAIGVNVPERTIARRGVEWREEESRRRAAREQMTALVEAMKEGNWSAAEMIQALATDALMMNPDALTGADPLKVQAQNLKAEELRIKRSEMELRRRVVELDEKRLTAALDKEQKTLQAAQDLERKAERGEQISPEDIRRIRDIYGLKEVAA